MLKVTENSITLRSLRPDDAKALVYNLKNKNDFKWTVNIPTPYRKKEAIKFITSRNNQKKKRKSYTYGITLKPSKDLIGVISLTEIDRKNRNARLGYWLSKKYRNQGIATVSVKRITRIAIKKFKIRRIEARIIEDNIASQRVLKKNGFKKEGIKTKKWRFGRRWKNEIDYALVK